jgi:hypothetical protein
VISAPVARLPFASTVFLMLAMLGAAAVSRAQGVISVADTTGWSAWTTTSGATMVDPRNDQQTGQGQDDFVGDATYAGFQQKAGTLNGVNTLMFRARFDKFDGVNQWGNGGNFGLGMDLDGNGSVDLVMMMSEGSGNVNNRTRTITFGTPGTGANDSPSTTSWTFPTQTAINLTTYSGSNASTATYSLQGTTDAGNFGGNQDAWLTFGISFANLQAAIRAYASGSFANFVVDYTTRIAFIGYTSTQNNALNQDLFGTAGGTSSTTTFASLGAMTPPVDAYGKVPEPATYAQLGALLVAGAFIAWRRRRASAATPKSPGQA